MFGLSLGGITRYEALGFLTVRSVAATTERTALPPSLWLEAWTWGNSLSRFY